MAKGRYQQENEEKILKIRIAMHSDLNTIEQDVRELRKFTEDGF